MIETDVLFTIPAKPAVEILYVFLVGFVVEYDLCFRTRLQINDATNAGYVTNQELRLFSFYQESLEYLHGIFIGKEKSAPARDARI